MFILLGPLTLKIAWQLRCLGCQNQALILNETDITIGPPHAGVPVPIPPDPALFPHLYYGPTTAKLETPPSSAGRAAASSGDAALPSPILVPPRATEHFPIGSHGDGVPSWGQDARRESASPWMRYRFRTCLPT